MKTPFLIVTAALLCLTAPAYAQDTPGQVTVFVAVAPRQAIDARTPEQRIAAANEAQKALDALERSLKQQHGKKRDAWPADAQEQLLAAAEATGLARVARYYGVASPSIGDSADDVRRGLGGAGIAVRQKHVRQVASAGEAQLVVEILDRRSADGGGFGLGKMLNTAYFVLFSIKAGPQGTPEQVAQAAQLFKGPWVARPRDGAPEWLFEAYANGSWKSAGVVASSIIDAFAKAQLAGSAAY